MDLHLFILFILCIIMWVRDARDARVRKRLLSISDQLDEQLRARKILEPRIPTSTSLRKTIGHSFVLERIEAQIAALEGDR